MTDPGSVITLENVSRRFGETIALNNVSLILNEGEFFALLGPSGCGKTTLLRMIAGFEHPDRGRVLLDGQDITRLRPNRRPVNMMFQSYALFPHMSVAANIAYGLEMEKIDKNTINRRVDQIIETTKLSVIANRKPDQLSGGQRQRVALARALIKEPRVLLLDEPLAALDRKLRAQMQLELKRLQHELGITFIVVTHDQEEALGMADRIAVMNSGVIEQIGTPQSLYNEPANTFVADFIGVSNFLEGIYTSGKFVTETHGSFTLSEHTPLPERTDATMVIRPEALLLTQDQSLPDYHAIKGKIIDTIYGGKHTNVIVAVDGVTKGFTAQLESHTPTVSLSPDTTIWCNWKPSSAHLLQTAT